MGVCRPHQHCYLSKTDPLFSLFLLLCVSRRLHLHEEVLPWRQLQQQCRFVLGRAPSCLSSAALLLSSAVCLSSLFLFPSRLLLTSVLPLTFLFHPFCPHDTSPSLAFLLSSLVFLLSLFTLLAFFASQLTSS